jgi:hypothetical protein
MRGFSMHAKSKPINTICECEEAYFDTSNIVIATREK